MKTILELADELDQLPAQLARARGTASEAGRQIKILKEIMADLEADALSDVSMELGQNGKPLYSNKESREAAARKKVAANERYAHDAVELTKQEIAKQNADIEVSLLEDRQRSLHAQLDAAASERRGEAIREFNHSLLELVRLEAVRLAQKESAHV